MKMKRDKHRPGSYPITFTREDFNISTAGNYSYPAAVTGTYLLQILGIDLYIGILGKCIEGLRTPSHGCSMIMIQHTTSRKYERKVIVGAFGRRQVVYRVKLPLSPLELIFMHIQGTRMIGGRTRPVQFFVFKSFITNSTINAGHPRNFIHYF